MSNLLEQAVPLPPSDSTTQLIFKERPILLSVLKPLFIPLKREYFEAFRNGSKETEYRVYGPRWNERTCPIGREVVLSLGYGKQHRLHGSITTFAKDTRITETAPWKACYGNHPGPAACMTIRVYAEVSA